MKKLLMILLSAALVLSMAGVVAADTEISASGNTGQTILTYTVDESFKVIIPAGMDNSGMDVSATVLLDKDESLTVTVTSANGWKLQLTDETSTEVAYKLTGTGSDINTNGATVLTVTSGTTTGSVTLTPTPEEFTKSGIYTDTLTFTVTVA